MVPDHGCTSYCRDDEHCDLVYSGDHANEKLVRQSIALAYQGAYGIRVTRVQPATEAPDLSMSPPESLRVVSGPESGMDDSRRWLVWWREDARPDLPTWRKRLGMTQAQLAAALDVPVNTIARWERGEITIGHVRVLELALRQLETTQPPNSSTRGASQ